MKQWAQNKQGFTIVELLIVVVVIAILAAITIVAYNGIRDRADTSAMHSSITQAYKSIESQKQLTGSYPASTDAVGLSDAGGVDYDLQTFAHGACVSAKKGEVVYHVSSDTGKPTFGGCGQVKAEYWNNTTFAGTPNAVTYVNDINLSLGANSPLPGTINADSFTSRLTTYLTPPVTGTYTFYSQADDVEKVVINGVTLLDIFTAGGGCCTLRTLPTINLTAGVTVPVIYEHREGAGGASMQLFWTHPSQATRVAVPASAYTRVAN